VPRLRRLLLLFAFPALPRWVNSYRALRRWIFELFNTAGAEAQPFLSIYGTAKARALIRIILFFYRDRLHEPSRHCGNSKSKVILDSAKEHKVPPPYERAYDGARSLNGRRDDELWGG
jgi:hypothetical protein